MKRNEEKRRELLEKRKKLSAALELEMAQKEAENKRKIVEVIEENFGEINEENLQILKQVMGEQREQIVRRREQLERNTDL